ncbi:hypothetical protein RBH20_19450 [Haloarcula sp. H-GB4]|uniref:hypothetical protein n=1 Tax=Haloarcula sp. H-GB4 TaxID=3069755 RepID=UPI0027B63844|nr:hypothetical protein [Haloarcula sp. H-GB4]MDQ2074708.1 hypothetical protein [Haloarcula sp. H-GB4]
MNKSDSSLCSRRWAGIAPATAGTMDRSETRDRAERSAPSSESALASEDTTDEHRESVSGVARWDVPPATQPQLAPGRQTHACDLSGTPWDQYLDVCQLEPPGPGAF